jgi:2-succinyl-5-enolpyruvyl-6-hydroxy-3-cyclohexene-1-carboxylate synthase
VIVAGATTDRATGVAARRLAAVTGWPLLAEPSSAARAAEAVGGPYRLLLDDPALAGGIERIVVYGRPTLSRPVTRLLNRPDVDLVLVSPWPHWPDPGRPASRVHQVTGPPADTLAVAWSRRWRRAGEAARKALDAVLDAYAEPTGPAVARAVVAALRDGESLVVAASNPIRDVDLVAGALPERAHVLANRGLSGIDGTLSTATGHALATGRTTRALVGDLATLHDLNALLLPPTEARPARLQVVVVNDAGGGIFSLLEHGELAERDAVTSARFERLFATPHRVDLAALCAGLGVPHRSVGSLSRLDDVVSQPDPGVSVVEVPVSRALLRPLHADIRARVGEAVAASL